MAHRSVMPKETVGGDHGIPIVAMAGGGQRRTNPPSEQVRFGSVMIDFRRLRAFDGKRELSLTDLEFRVLACLAGREGSIVTRDELLSLVWGNSDAPLTRTVDALMFRLRQKFEADPHRPRYLRTAYGDGYRLILGD